MKKIGLFLVILVFFASITNGFSSDEGGETKMEYTDMVMEHIGNSNEFHIWGDVHVPLPCILWSKDGLKMFSSSNFEHGHKSVDGYVIHHGLVKRLVSGNDIGHVNGFEKVQDGENVKLYAIGSDGSKHEVEGPKTLINRGSSWIDFSITKNVLNLILATIALFIIFYYVARGYKKREGKAPKGIQSFFEVLIVFIRDEVAIPAIGPKWHKYFPFILALFFFVLINNLFGLIPFFPFGANVTGNVSTTLILALFVFIVVTISGNKQYWQHVFWMPGVPFFVKLILTPIEFFGLFIKPFTLFIRLFANIAAGHIIILSLIGLIFLFGNNGHSFGGSMGGIALAVPFVFAMNFLELFVAFLQAFIFALLSSLYIGAAVEEHH